MEVDPRGLGRFSDSCPRPLSPSSHSPERLSSLDRNRLDPCLGSDGDGSQDGPPYGVAPSVLAPPETTERHPWVTGHQITQAHYPQSGRRRDPPVLHPGPPNTKGSETTTIESMEITKGKTIGLSIIK